MSHVVEKPDFNTETIKKEFNGPAQMYFPVLTTLMTSEGRDKNGRVLDRTNIFVLDRTNIFAPPSFVAFFVGRMYARETFFPP